jgi:hypothetical protein
VTTPDKPEQETRTKPAPANPKADPIAPQAQPESDELTEAELDKSVGGYTIRRPPTPTPPPPPVAP